MAETPLYAVTGRPIFRSRSPLIFNSLFAALGLDAVYLRLAAAGTREALKSAETMKIEGMNVTAPFKEKTARRSDTLDPPARTIRASNCVVRRDGRIEGYNTDVEGVRRAFESRGISIAGKSAAVLGAGGAARAAALGLLQGGAGRVVVLNRHHGRAREAARLAGCDHAPAGSMDRIFGETDLLVSCIPAGKPVEKLGLLKEGAVVLDADYRDPSFLAEARRLGHPTADGLDWLVRQAVPAFRIMTGRDVPPEALDGIEQAVHKPWPEPKPNLALAGLSGAGKTTIGRLLAKIRGGSFLDTDAAIEESAGLSVDRIFKARGEAFFRSEEKALIGRLVPSARGTVFSLGGGAILDRESREVIRKHCHVVWLWVSPAAAIRRIPAGGRPLLEGPDPERRAEDILKARIAAYARACDIVVDTESGRPKGLARRIADEVD